MVEYPTSSNYEAVIEVTDAQGEQIDLTGVDSLEYVITERQGINELFSITDESYNFNLEDVDDDTVPSTARIYIEPDEVTWSNVVWEELRVNFTNSQSTVVFQSPVSFFDVGTQPF